MHVKEGIKKHDIHIKLKYYKLKFLRELVVYRTFQLDRTLCSRLTPILGFAVEKLEPLEPRPVVGDSWKLWVLNGFSWWVVVLAARIYRPGRWDKEGWELLFYLLEITGIPIVVWTRTADVHS